MALYCDVFCEKGYFTVNQSRRILETGIKYGLKPRLHADEFIDSNPMVKTIVQSLGGKEKAMEWVLGKVGDLTNKKGGSSPGSTEWR